MTIPNIYVAGASGEISRVKHWIAKLTEEGFRVTYDWTEPVEAYGSEGEALREHQLRMFARNDLRGIDEANVFWLLAPLDGATTVGAWIELGYALGDWPNQSCRRMAVVVSPSISEKAIFGKLPVVREFEDDEKAFEFIGGLT